jgi:shikimate kinase
VSETNQPEALPLRRRSIVLVGLMGAGKSTVGRRLASQMGMPFCDADTEIERAAGQSISEIFEAHGEDFFRDGERRVIARLLSGDRMVLATGGGAFMNEQTRELIGERAISVWLNADFNLLMKRVLRRNNRPLLQQGDPRQIMKDLMETRYPVYALSDIAVEAQDGPHSQTVQRIVNSLEDYFDEKSAEGGE